ncbi:MAG: M56 family metallopeptidase, partial [Candidatus Bipolaricaulia bacterium]
MSFLDLIGPMARGTVEVLFNSLLAGMALTALIWGLLRLVRRINATTRYVVWYVTLLAVICLPLFIFISQVPSETGRTPLNAPVSVEVPSAPIPRAQETLPPRLQEASDLTGDTTLSTPVATEAQDAPQPARLRWRSPVWRFPEQGVLFVFGAWLFGAVSLMARLLWSYAHLGRLKQTSSPLLRTDQLQLQQWMTAFGVRRRVHLHSSPEIAVPMTVGLINPVILLPESFLTQLTETELDQVVLHELAHLQRWDDWSNMVQKLIQVAFFFHPAIMWIGRRLHLEREVACDDWVTAKLGGDSRSYATCLIKLVELALHQQQPLLEIESGTMMAKTQIQRRITRLLDKQRTITARVSKVRLLTTLGGLIAGVVLFAQVTPVIAVFVSPPEPPDTTVSQVNQTGEDTGKIQEINEFIEALQDEDWRVRLSAARTLREMGPKAKDAVPALIEALGDARAPVRSLAVTALRAIGSDAVPALVEALQDKEVREFAVEALGRISPADTQEVIPVLVKVLHN